MTKSTSTKKKVVVCLCMALILAITGAIAFLTSTDSKTNVFTIGKVDIDLIEDFYVNNNGTIDANETFNEDQPAKFQNVQPSQEILKKPRVKNDGNNDAYVFLKVTMPKKGGLTLFNEATGSGKITKAANEMTELFTMYQVDSTNNTKTALPTTVGGQTADQKWELISVDTTGTDANVYVFAYVGPTDGKLSSAAGNNMTGNLFDMVKTVNYTQDSVDGTILTAGSDLELVVDAYAIQSSGLDAGVDTPAEAWAVYTAQTATTTAATEPQVTEPQEP